MVRKIFAFACAALIAASAMASEQTDAIAVVHQFADGMNSGNTQYALAAFANETFIIDDMAPHFWHGKGAIEQWLTAVDADIRKSGITDSVLSLEDPTNIKISGDHAYAVIPFVYAYKIKGNPGHGAGTLTVALQKETGNWRISAIAFTVS